jgi:hypothetical protein
VARQDDVQRLTPCDLRPVLGPHVVHCSA